MKLIIVESPTKAKTISQFLGKDFEVESSYGHVRDLPKSTLGIDVENNFQPTYVIPTKSRKTINELKKASKNAEDVILATDEDREGESISWHLASILNLKNPKRIVFHEITKKAIEEPLKNPRGIDINLVDAQQARRILDRIVGYELSPFLWKKLFQGLSAGRVQSVAVRLIVDREKEIEKFIPKEYWNIVASFKNFEAILFLDKFAIKTKAEADKIIKDLDGAKYVVEKIEKKETKRLPKPPFTTSTLQQEASIKLHFSAKQTMMFAQHLYENGYISYMRTDSFNLSEDSLRAAEKFIDNNFGKNYLSQRRFKTKSKGAQEAHEAIRPTQPENTPEILKNKLDIQQFKLYDLIWRRFIACQMQEAVFDSTIVDIKAKKYIFRASGQVLKFDGFLKVYPMKFEENELPALKEKEILELIKLASIQHFTEPPARYSEASLIKALEEHGIGRPSTYSPTIATIQERNYVVKNEQKRFVPTETGTMVNNLLVEHFPKIVDIQFTSKMEEDLDDIAEGKTKWIPVIKNFYEPFHKNLEEKYESVKKQNTEKKTDEVCEKCGKPMVIKRGRFGEFLACSGFPECKNTKTIKKDAETINMKCPKCKEGDVVVKRTKKGKIFYGCSRYPACDFASWAKPEK
ncbi:MAG: type I DNA topoisomerase [Candidatus Parcubacteria bacterium]|nr:type I DNA topoisomerase [Candidatus Parcubacteria bacterium]